MKRSTLTAFVFGIALALVLGFGTLRLIHGLDEARAKFIGLVIMSSADITDKIEREGFTLPLEAYNLNYHHIALLSHRCWFAFSASAQQIDEFLDNHDSKNANLHLQVEGPFVYTKPTEKDTSFAADWWPKDLSGYELYNGRTKTGFHYIVVLNRSNKRVYVHSFSSN